MLKTGDSGVREMKKIKVITLFTGIGAQEAALKRLGIDYEVVGISEIDKYAIQSYEAINGSTYNYGDITKINALDYADLWTYSSPCQDFSTAGKQQGIRNADGSLTRSGLLLHVERLLVDSVIRGDNPKYLLMENVKGLISKKFKPDFDRWLERLEQLGYNNYWQILNAKDYGVPQNRERVFVVSIRKDVDTKGYKFPEKIPLVKRLKDVLESVVDEKYYLSDKIIKGFFKKIERNENKPNGFNKKINVSNVNNVSSTITARYWKCGITDPYIPVICASRGRNPDNPSDRTTGAPTEQRLEINQTGCTNTITTVQKDNYVIVPEATKQGYAKAYEGDSINLEQPNSKTRRGRVGNQISNTLLCSCNVGVVESKIIQVGNIYESKGQNGNVYDINGICPTISSGVTNTKGNGGIGSNNAPKVINNYRIRKLTPRECWRLMGFTDVEFDCAQMSGMSNTQLYKQAGNSIVVDVLVGIFKELLS